MPFTQKDHLEYTVTEWCKEPFTALLETIFKKLKENKAIKSYKIQVTHGKNKTGWVGSPDDVGTTVWVGYEVKGVVGQSQSIFIKDRQLQQ